VGDRRAGHDLAHERRAAPHLAGRRRVPDVKAKVDLVEVGVPGHGHA
jgi:hypothetical protein